jgi:hypothetical protein
MAKTPKPEAPQEIRLEYVALAELKRWPKNAKDHDLPEINAFYDRFGYVMPMLEDARSGKLVAGHGRLEMLEVKQAGGEPPPDRIIARDGDWWVPVIRGVAFKSDKEAAAYLLADNKISERGGWDADLLAEFMKENDIAAGGIGFSQNEIDKMIVSNADAELEGVLNLGEGSPAIIIECASEKQQRQLLNRFAKEGLKARALM